MFLDVYMNLSSPAAVSGEVTIVTIGPEALHLWNPEDAIPEVTPRAFLAELITTLDEAGARTIVLDIILDISDDNDEKLAQAARKHGAVHRG